MTTTTPTPSTDSARAARAAELDRADPLAGYRDRFVGSDDPSVLAYVDGNSLGRPVRGVAERMAQLVETAWGGRLIRHWDEGWFDLPLTLGDRIGATCLGAASGQTVVGESTTVSLYKLVRTALAARPGRREIVIDRHNCPTDRFVVEGVAAETGASIRWIDVDTAGGPTVDDLAAVLGPQTAVVVLSHVAYRSGHLADAAAITELVHSHGALVLWDLCHSVGVVPIELDAWGVDLAVGCTYKYLNGGPGAPAFLYVRDELIPDARQPIQGWMGVKDSFRMGEAYDPADGIRRFISGTPPVVGMQPMQAMLDLIEEAGIEAVRAKSVAMKEFAVELYDAVLAPLGVPLSTPRDASQHGGHVTGDHPAFVEIVPELWRRGVIPDFRPPTGIRLGLSPLSTSFAELELAVAAVRDELVARA